MASLSWDFTIKMLQDPEELHALSIFVGILMSILLLFCIIYSCLSVGDERINYLAWKKHPSSNNIHDSNQTALFDYNVGRTMNTDSSKFALPPTEFYDVIAKLHQQINITETQQFLQRFNCEDRLSFPTSSFPSLKPIFSISKCE